MNLVSRGKKNDDKILTYQTLYRTVSLDFMVLNVFFHRHKRQMEWGHINFCFSLSKYHEHLLSE